MKKTYVKSALRTLSLLLSIWMLPLWAFPALGSASPFSGVAGEYYESLIEKGFPEDYAYALTELHLLHPTWEFNPLLITEEKSEYTWDYVLTEESEDPSNNIISSSENYAAYRHPTNEELYDSSYYQVSREGLSYFMDPRNFLNETDIFQFFDLSTCEGVSEAAIESVLAGTFMEAATLENGKTFSQYFMEVGSELGLNPIYLAVKARQEQGVGGTSPIISGECGTLLDTFYQNGTQTGESGLLVLAPTEGHTSEELLALDGYYNLFNISASGNGVFSIYYNAMSRAITGTADKAQEWGSPAWDTLWKSLYGGAAIIKKSYVSDYKNTIYLQKFNVDSRASGNFWKQYMQNVTGAFTEARTFYTSFASTGMLDSVCTFLIPVFGQMPEAPSPDPANGECSYLAVAPLKYDHSHTITLPTLLSASDTPSYGSVSANAWGFLELACEVEHSYGVRGLEYSWDGGSEWVRISDTGSASVAIPITFDEGTVHVLTLRGIADYDHTVSAKKTNFAFLCAVIYVSITAAEPITLTLKNGDTETVFSYAAGTPFPLPALPEEGFVGWYTQDGTLLPAGATVRPTKDVSYRSLILDYEQLDGAALIPEGEGARLRFFAALDATSRALLSSLGDPATLHATLEVNGETLLTEATEREQLEAFGKVWYMTYADTDLIDRTHIDDVYTAKFYLSITYSNGVTRVIDARGTEENDRSVRAVATAALADADAAYSATLISTLRDLVS